LQGLLAKLDGLKKVNGTLREGKTGAEVATTVAAWMATQV
jgi:hypothetical protein